MWLALSMGAGTRVGMRPIIGNVSRFVVSCAMLCITGAMAATGCVGGAIEATVSNTTHVDNLAEALACSDAQQLFVSWYGNVKVSSTLTVRNNTVLNIIGRDGAAIEGGGGLRLFSILDGATLKLYNVSVGKGHAQDGTGGAIFVDEASHVALHHCSFTDNFASLHGGELHICIVGIVPCMSG